MAQIDATVMKLLKHLQDKTCLCDMEEALPAVKCWLRGQEEHDNVQDGGNLENDTCPKKKQDGMLCYLTVSKQLFEATHCAHVLHLQHDMMGKGSLLDRLGSLMSSEDRLTAFMTCQMAKAVLSSPAIHKKTAVSFLHNHLQSIRNTVRHASLHHEVLCSANSPRLTGMPYRYPGQKQQGQVNPIKVNEGQIDLNPADSSQVYEGQIGSGQHHYCWATSGQVSMGNSCGTLDVGKVSKLPHLDWSRSNLGQVNHAVFTFDLCRLLLKKNFDEESQQVTSENTDMTQGSHQPSCRQDAHLTANIELERLQDFQKELEHMLCRDLPGIFQEYASPLPAGSPYCATVDDSTDSTDILILTSLLDLVHTLLKHRTAEQHWQGFTSKMESSLMQLFKDCSYNVIILKKLLDIFILFLDHSAMTSCIPHSDQSPSSHTATSLDEALITMATSFVIMVAKGNFLEHLPYRSGPIGFGGGTFHHSGHTSVESFGDRPLLRKLYRAALCAVQILLNSQNSKRNDDESGVASCLQVLWGYVSRKLNCIMQSEVPIWLVFELFSEQDDSLVWVMHRCLDLYQATQSHPSCSLLADQLNPNRIFCKFLDTVAYDPSVLLDLLISSETLFLEYLVSYLHTILRDWALFCNSLQEVASLDSKSQSQNSSDTTSIKPSMNEPYIANCDNADSNNERVGDVNEMSTRTKRRKTEVTGDSDQETGSPRDDLIISSSSISHKLYQHTDAEDVKQTTAQDSSEAHTCTQTLDMLCSQSNIVSQPLDDVMTTLIRLRFSIERISGSDLFPYPITPLLRLLRRVEGMYEGNTDDGP